MHGTFRSRHGSVWHAFDDCVQPVVRVDGEERFKLKACRRCVRRVPCLMCGEASQHAVCSMHCACAECFEHMVQSSDASHLCCPMDGSPIDVQTLPPPLFDLWRRRFVCDRGSRSSGTVHAPSTEVCEYIDPVDVVVERILTPHCPGCDRVFVDFDACAALRCTCGCIFCAFCFERCSSMDAAHAHIRTCDRRPREMDDPFFVNIHDWAALMRRDATARIMSMLHAMCDRSMVSAVVLAIRLARVHPELVDALPSLVACAVRVDRHIIRLC